MQHLNVQNDWNKSYFNQMHIETELIPKTDLKSLSPQELHTHCEQMGLKRYRSDQLYQWLYGKQAKHIDDMTNLSKSLRAELKERYFVNTLQAVQEQRSKDGTIKFLFALDDGKKVEAVLIPEFFEDGVADRLTVCISSQVGCVFGCAFCATGKMGFFRNLTHGEIVDQVLHVNKISEEVYQKRITNIVYMGMGEPLHNYKAVMESAAIICDPRSLNLSPKRITISTVGLTDKIQQWADEEHPYNLAISLHAPDDVKRNEIMPINERLDLEKLENAVRYFVKKLDKRITYEYLLFEGFNDGNEDARNLARICSWASSKVNIIMYNNVDGVTLNGAKEGGLNRFLGYLKQFGVRATVRRSRGDDIDAGCGQLAIREGQPRGKSLRK